MKTLPERIRTAREEAGLSQVDVAKALRISASAVNQWEHGFTKNIKLEYFFALAHLLDQDPQWLATGKVHPRAREKGQPAGEGPTLSIEERTLLHYIRQMPDTLRKLVFRFLKGLHNLDIPPNTPRH